FSLHPPPPPTHSPPPLSLHAALPISSHADHVSRVVLYKSIRVHPSSTPQPFHCRSNNSRHIRSHFSNRALLRPGQEDRYARPSILGRARSRGPGSDRHSHGLGLQSRVSV